MLSKSIWTLFIVAIASLSSAFSYAGEFKISALNKGQEVTLTGRSKTTVPHGERFYLAATDLPQTVSFKQVWKGNKKSSPELEIAIYDKNNDNVKYINLNKSVPQIYTLKSTERVLVIAKKVKGKNKLALLKGQSLQVESNKPLTIAR